MSRTTTWHLRHAHRVWGRAHVACAVAVPTPLPGWLRTALATAWPRIPALAAAPWQLSIRVVGATEASATNQKFRGKSYVPDVLTFPLWQEGYAGDILLCWPKLRAEAAAQGKPLQAHAQHLLIHALLHLAGEDHLTPAQAHQMEAQEIAILALLGWPNPYLIG